MVTKKEEIIKYIPELAESEINSVSSNTVSISNSVIDDGNDEVVERGVCWNTSVDPTITNYKTNDGKGVGNFTSNLNNLNPGNQYYFRAYATNLTGTAYAPEIGLKTLPENADNLSDAINIVSITPISALSGGETYTFDITVFYRLSTLESGTLMIGFNNTEIVNSMRIISDLKEVIEKGNGQYTFTVSITVKDWGPEGDFIAYVNLSENPLPSPWTPLASDRFVLIPKHN